MSIDKPSIPVERPHHPYSPSKLQYLEACPKYVSRSGASEAAELGTRQHTAVERGHVDDNMDDESAHAVAMCLDFRDTLLERYPEGLRIQEVYLPVDDDDTSAGYLDFAVVNKEKTAVAIIDYKFGRFAVEDAENNLQGMAYLLGLVHKYPTIRKGEVFFLLPKRDEITSAVFTESQFDAMLLRIRTVVARVKDPNSKARPTAGACLFCERAVKNTCPELHPFILNIARKFAPLTVPENISPTVLADAVTGAQGLQIAQVVEIWAKAYRAQRTAQASEEDGIVPEGYELTAVARREVSDIRAMREVCLRYVNQEILDAATKITLGPLEKAVSALAPRGNKAAAVSEFSDALQAAGATKLGVPYPVLKLKT